MFTRWRPGRKVGPPDAHDWMASEAGRPLSLSMPFTGTQALRGAPVNNYFENLLPDSEPIRKRLATRFKTDTLEAFDLLEAIGRDCVGAIQLLGADESPVNVATIEGTSLNEGEVEELLMLAAGSGPHPGVEDNDNFRVSCRRPGENGTLVA